MKYRILTYMVLSFNSVFAINFNIDFNRDFHIRPDNILCITIPKSGTHLLTKCLTLLEIEKIKFGSQNEKHFDVKQNLKYKNNLKKIDAEKFVARTLFKLKNKMEKQFIRNRIRSFSSHLPYSSISESFVNRYTSKNFLMIRDPRDQLVSVANRTYKILPKSINASYNEILMDIIIGQKNANLPKVSLYRAMSSVGVFEYYNMFLPWSKNSKFCVVKFENLVGSMGGGSDIAQLQEIKKIARHLAYEIDQIKLTNLAKNLFGNSSTFNRGQIGSWKKHFTKEHKKAFKSINGANQLLIELGYEIDENW